MADIENIKAYRELWQSQFMARDTREFEAPEYYRLNLSEIPKLHKYPQLDGLRIYKVDLDSDGPSGGRVNADEQPGPIDVMVILRYDGYPEGRHVPNGVRCVIYQLGSMEEVPPLPSSVEMVIFDECNFLHNVRRLPSTVKGLVHSVGAYDFDPSPCRYELPEDLQYLELSEVRNVHIAGEMPQGLSVVDLRRMREVFAEFPFSPELTSIHYHAVDIDQLDEDHEAENNLEIPCTYRLQILTVENDFLKIVDGPYVQTMEEYTQYCRSHPRKKSARSARPQLN